MGSRFGLAKRTMAEIFERGGKGCLQAAPYGMSEKEKKN